MIVERDVVSGNFYDDMAVLMVISPMDKLWVWGNVYEKDQDQVHLGQTWDISFPYLDNLKVKGKVEHIAAKVDPNTRTLKIRASIPNPEEAAEGRPARQGRARDPAHAGPDRHPAAMRWRRSTARTAVFVQSRRTTPTPSRAR